MKTLDMEFIQTEATLKNLIYLFARSIDRVDEELMRELFWPDATDDHGLFTGCLLYTSPSPRDDR